MLLGYDALTDYVNDPCYFGCIVGRSANRIGFGEFTLDGERYSLATNAAPHHLHGGLRGFGRRVWEITALSERAVRLELESPTGDEGYPGTLQAQVTYACIDDHSMRVEMTAKADAPTLCNLAQHAYWNLGGHDSGTIEDHELELTADRYLPVDATTLPCADPTPVDGTPFDLRRATSLGARMRELDSDLGFDHPFVVAGHDLRPFARLAHRPSGRGLVLESDQPGLQLYAGGFLDGVRGKSGAVYEQHAGLCLESQVHPDAIHHESWPSPILRPGETYRHTMVLRFLTA